MGELVNVEGVTTLADTRDGSASSGRITGYVPGGFDMLHVGHINILRLARQQCDRLIVGVATDESLERMKGRKPIIPLMERCDLLASLRIVDAVVVDLDQDKRLAWRMQPFDVLFKGDDWKGTDKGARLERELAEVGARVVYLPYTSTTSSTQLRQFLTAELANQELRENNGRFQVQPRHMAGGDHVPSPRRLATPAELAR